MSAPDQVLNNTLPSKLDSNGNRARNNAMAMMALVASIREQETQIRDGGQRVHVHGSTPLARQPYLVF